MSRPDRICATDPDYYGKLSEPSKHSLALQGGPMNEMEKTLPPRHFLRVHRSYIVAIKHIRSIYGNSIELGKVTIPIGVNYKVSVMDLIGKR